MRDQLNFVMATYQKRGFKPKNKTEEKQADVQESTTAEVFSTLDEGASKTEEWVSRNQVYILGVIGVVAVAVLGYLAYNEFVQKPKEASAANEMFYPQQYFDQALEATAATRDSLFNLALSGAEGKYGFLDIIDEYGGTKAARLANYASGMAYLNLQKYEEAIAHLEEYSSDDAIFGALAKGGIGDAFMQLGQPGEALGYYEMAFSEASNGYTVPKFLYKAGITAMELDQNDKALGYFQRVKEEYPSSDEGRNIEAFIAMAKNGK